MFLSVKQAAKNAAGELLQGKAVLAFFLLNSAVFGVVIQLIWIKQFCDSHSFWGSDVSPCQENLYRLIFGGPVGMAALMIFYLLLFSLFQVALSSSQHRPFGRHLLLALSAFGLSVCIPLTGYKYNNLIYLLVLSVFFLILWVSMPQNSTGVLMFLKDFFYPRTGMNYDMRLDSGLLEINFKGKFNAGEEAVLYERLNADLAMLPRDISGVKLNTSQVHKDYPDFRSIGFVLLGFCSVRKIGLEVIADAEFSKSLSKGLAGLKTGAENKPARR